MAEINVRRGLQRVWIAVSVLWLVVSYMLAGDQALRSAQGLWMMRHIERPTVENAKIARVYSSEPSDVRTDKVRAPDGRIIWVEVKEKELMGAAIYADLERQAAHNFRALALTSLLPLALFWAALYGGFWIARGFSTGRA